MPHYSSHFGFAFKHYLARKFRTFTFRFYTFGFYIIIIIIIIIMEKTEARLERLLSPWNRCRITNTCYRIL